MLKKLIALLLCVLLLTGCAALPEMAVDTGEDEKPGAGHSIGEEETGGTGHPFGDGKEAAIQPVSVTTSTVRKESDSGWGNGTQTVDLIQAQVTFDRLPATAEELEQVDRTGENGKFVAVALLLAAYKTWVPEDEETCAAMMAALMESPSAEGVYTEFTRSFVKERMLQNGKWAYIADAYFDGASPENGYTPEEPLTVTLREYAYAPQISTIYGVELHVEKIVTEFSGADTERAVSVYEDPSDGRWYVFSDTYAGLLSDVREPEV